MKCSVRVCTGKAEYQLGFRAWARGHPKTSAPLEGFITIAVCEDCRSITKIDDFLTTEGKARINNALLAQGKCECDFATAEVIFHEIIDGKLYISGFRA